MSVLIVESNPELGRLWCRHLRRFEIDAVHVCDEDSAIDFLQNNAPGIIVLDLVLETGSAFVIADVASVLHPKAQVIFVTNSSFFSDGSIFEFSANACAMVNSDTSPEDLTALIEHYAKTTPQPAVPDHAVYGMPAEG